MIDVKCNQIRECAHGGMLKGSKVLRDLHLELEEKSCQFIIIELKVVCRWITGIGRHQGCPEMHHCIQTVPGNLDQVILATEGRSEIEAIDTDTRAIKSAAAE